MNGLPLMSACDRRPVCHSRRVIVDLLLYMDCKSIDLYRYVTNPKTPGPCTAIAERCGKHVV